MDKTRTLSLCLALCGLIISRAVGAELAPNHSSVAGNLRLWLRMPDVNYDPVAGVWTDLSGKGNDARADVAGFDAPSLSSGENPTVFAHPFGAVHCDPASTELLRATNLNGGVGLTDLTIFTVVKLVDRGGTDQRPVGFDSYTGGGRADAFNMSFDVTVRKNNGFISGKTQDLPLDQFVIYAARMTPAAINMWFNATGTLELVFTSTGTSYTTSTDEFYVGELRYSPGGDYDIAEVIAYNGALTDAQIEGISEWLQAYVGVVAATGASSPDPAHEAADVSRDVALSWKPLPTAIKRDVYFGTVFDDVNDATPGNPLNVLASQGQTETSYDPGRLDFGQTYYWRVDEVNRAPDNTVFTGDVWSFTVEPLSVPVDAITATASSAHAADMGPENTINGVGLNDLDQHSTESTEMWLSGMGDPAPTLQYEFNRPYKLHELWVWNSNQLIESFVGLGAKDVTIETSVDGADWTALENVPAFAQATGSPTYTANTVVDFEGVLARFVRITIQSGYGMLPQYSLSAVRFFYIPTFAREPQPVDAETTDTVDVTLNWRAGREAGVHEVYLGTDSEGLTLVATTQENSYQTTDLAFATTYYWQIVEVNDAEDPAAYAGPVWSFTTPAYGVVDDFDQYNDNCNRIFFAWLDGLGHNGGEDVADCDVPPYNGNGGGSIVGNATAPFAEQTIVYAGTQSMPLEYDNAFGLSETTLSFNAQDWSRHGIQTLSLAFRGATGNTGSLYVKINNTKVMYGHDPADIALSMWQVWNVDLAAVGANLTNVTTLTIGIEGATAAGMLYIDAIRLYPQAGELITPTDPGNANLAGVWAFDEGSGTVAADSSGNGRDGAIVDALWDTGKQGSALSFTENAYVETAYPGITGTASRSCCAWIKTLEADRTIMSWGQNVTGRKWRMRLDATGGLRVEVNGGYHYGTTFLADDEWHHVAVTLEDDGSANVLDTLLYVDGRADSTLASQSTDIDTDPTGVVRIGLSPYHTSGFIGLIDEARVYNRALSPGEIAWLAGLSQPFDKPFAD